MLLFLMALAALATSIISGIIGMGGGVLLISLMSLFLDYKLLIPIHGIVQFVSNSSRCFMLKKHIRKDFFIPFLLGVPIGFMIAYFILKEITQTHYLYLLLAILIFYTIFKPKKLPQIKLNSYGWTYLGIASGILGPLIGPTGPLIAPFYVRDDIQKEEIVATKASQQIITHFLKIPLFLSLDFSYTKHLSLILFMSVAAILGTRIGLILLKQVNTEIFKLIFKIMLFSAGVRILIKFWNLI